MLCSLLIKITNPHCLAAVLLASCDVGAKETWIQNNANNTHTHTHTKMWVLMGLKCFQLKLCNSALSVFSGMLNEPLLSLPSAL